jgi:hypothetical protein
MATVSVLPMQPTVVMLPVLPQAVQHLRIWKHHQWVCDYFSTLNQVRSRMEDLNVAALGLAMALPALLTTSRF